jgi:hypothetical protein
MRLVTDEDMKPGHGWACEACHREFAVGDEVYGTLLGAFDDGTPIEGDYRCAECFHLDRPVPDETTGDDA